MRNIESFNLKKHRFEPGAALWKVETNSLLGYGHLCLMAEANDPLATDEVASPLDDKSLSVLPEFRCEVPLLSVHQVEAQLILQLQVQAQPVCLFPNGILRF